jgi:hypothetical protein
MTKAQNGEANAYNQWLATEIQEAINDPGPSIPHEEPPAKSGYPFRAPSIIQTV